MVERRGERGWRQEVRGRRREEVRGGWGEEVRSDAEKRDQLDRVSLMGVVLPRQSEGKFRVRLFRSGSDPC